MKNHSQLKDLIIDKDNVVDLLLNADWDYEHCGDRIKSGDMESYIYEISENINEASILEILSKRELEIISEFKPDYADSINDYAALYIADEVAQSFIDCVYQAVTFKAIF